MTIDSKTMENSRVIHIEDGGLQNASNLTDEKRLAQMGHQQELERRFSLPALGALCLCLMATWEALSTVISSALTSGGPPCLFYNYVLSFLCSVAIAASLGEIASIYPTSGGQYHWTAALSPQSNRKFSSWYNGWISVGGQIVFTASAAFAAGLQFQACIIMNNLSYSPQRWQGMLFYWLVLVYGFVMNVWGIKFLPHVNIVSGLLHIGAFLGILVTIGVMSNKNTSSFVFTDFQNNSGWESNGISWLVGLQSAIYPFLGYDAASHLAEELHNPSRNVPLAMVGSVVVNGLMGFVYCVVLLYAAPPLTRLLNNPYGFPFMEIYLEVTHSRPGATVMSLMLCFVASAATAACMTSTSRTLWAFARDRGVPYHMAVSKVGKSSQIPLTAVVIITILEFLLGLIYLGNSTAFYAILSMAIIGMYISYAIPIVYMLFGGRQRIRKSDYGTFRLGPIFGPVLNIIGLIWMVVSVIFSAFPTIMPVTPQNMNYSVVVMAGWTLFGLIFYVWYGRHKFDVPLHAVEAVVERTEETLFGDVLAKAGTVGL